MKAEINEYGDLVVSPETNTENFAIYHWYKHWYKQSMTPVRLIVQVPEVLRFDPQLVNIYATEKEIT